MCQWFNVLNCQSATRSALQPRPLPEPLAARRAVAERSLLQAAVMYWPPLNELFHTRADPAGRPAARRRRGEPCCGPRSCASCSPGCARAIQQELYPAWALVADSPQSPPIHRPATTVFSLAKNRGRNTTRVIDSTCAVDRRRRMHLALFAAPATAAGTGVNAARRRGSRPAGRGHDRPERSEANRCRATAVGRSSSTCGPAGAVPVARKPLRSSDWRGAKPAVDTR